MTRRTLYLLAGMLWITLAGASQAQNLLTEDFEYPVSDSLEGVSSWSGHRYTNNVRVVSPGLSFAGYVGSDRGNTAYLSNVPEGDLVTRWFPAVSSGSIYLSLLLLVDSLTPTATSGYVTALDQSGGATNLGARLTIRRVSATTFNLGITKIAPGAVYGAATYETGTTYLVVVRYTWLAATTTDDTVKLFVSASGVPAAEPEPVAVTGGGNDAIDAGELCLSNSFVQSGLAGSPVRVDGMRLGTTWVGAVLSDVPEAGLQVPRSIVLEQNYPNPFNPVTTVRYGLPGDSRVTLEVFDAVGRQIAVLVNGEVGPGYHQVAFDGKNLSSGVYVCRLKAGTVIQTKRLLLLR